MLETVADQRTEILEESLSWYGVGRSFLLNISMKEKKKGLVKSPIGVSTVLECARQTSFWVRLAGMPTVNVHPFQRVDGRLQEGCLVEKNGNM
jgi:hypothetical protein